MRYVAAWFHTGRQELAAFIFHLGRNGRPLVWLWPLHKFWTFTPWGWGLAVIWNVCELRGWAMPCAGWAFGVITGYAGARVK